MKKKTHEEYVAELAIKNPDIEVIGKYVDTHTKVLHKCKIDGYEWYIMPLNATKGYGCPKCAGNIKKSHNDYVNELYAINLNIEVVGKYKNTKTAILHRCKIDKYEWNAKPNNILNGKGCPKCAGNIKKTHEEYVEEVFKINPDIRVTDQYINSKTPILHKCLIDNYEWKVSPTEILSGSGCPQCSESSGERRVRQWLQKQNIQYEFQKRYDDCRDKNTLPFDFYLPTYNSIIEYDDRQHFEPIEHFGGDEKFKIQQKHDNIKNEYCKNNGISLLRIPYYKNVEEELNNFLFI